EDDFLRVAGANEPRDLLARAVDRVLGFPAERVIPARRMAELLREVGDHRVHDPRIDGRGRLRIHEDRELHRHLALLRLSLWARHHRIASVSGAFWSLSSARLMVSSRWLIAVCSFCTGRFRLQRSSCGHPPWSRQLTMLIGPSRALTTSPTEMSFGRRVKTYPPLGPFWLTISRRLASRCRVLASNSGGIPNSSAIRLALTAPSPSLRAM